jgi:hypothetical protein
MILLTLIAGGLLSLSAVSLRSSSQGIAQAEAQANARLALMLALGDLQKHLGPDQRVSMSADQRPKPDTEGMETSTAVGNRHWTGVFDSWPAAANTRPSPVFRSWLVSGDSLKMSKLNTAETALTGNAVIDLVGDGTLGSAGTGMVKAPAVDFTMNGAKTGRMAWWIGDQGVKAAVATHLPFCETTCNRHLAMLPNWWPLITSSPSRVSSSRIPGCRW